MKEKHYPKESRLEYLPPARQANPQGARVLGETSSDQECSTCDLAGSWFLAGEEKNPQSSSHFCSAPGASHHRQGTSDGSPKPKQTRPILNLPQQLAKAMKNSETKCNPGI